MLIDKTVAKPTAITTFIIAVLTLMPLVSTAYALPMIVEAHDVEDDGRVVDGARLLTDVLKEEFDERARAVEEAFDARVFIVFVGTTEGTALPEFSEAVLDAWELSPYERRRAIMLVYADADNDTYVHLGPDLAPLLPHTDDDFPQHPWMYRDRITMWTQNYAHHQGMDVAIDRVIDEVVYRISPVEPEAAATESPTEAPPPKDVTISDLPDYDFEFPVVDPDGLLTREQHHRLARRIADHEDYTGIPIAIAIANSGYGADLEEVARQVFDEGRLGSGERRDGVLWIAAVDDGQQHLAYDDDVREAASEDWRNKTLWDLERRLDAGSYDIAAWHAVDRITEATDHVVPGEEIEDPDAHSLLEMILGGLCCLAMMFWGLFMLWSKIKFFLAGRDS